MTATNDALLVSRAALLGDKGAFCRLVETYQSPIRRFLFNLTEGDEELSKDLAQEVFIKAWLNIGSFRAAAKFSTIQTQLLSLIDAVAHLQMPSVESVMTYFGVLATLSFIGFAVAETDVA